jgi:glycosyltransferase involved in cell wall biosynthesis
MRPVAFIVPDLGHASHAKQVSLLAPAIKSLGHAVSVFSLTGAGPFAGPIWDAGIEIEGRHARRPWDLGDWFNLRRRVRATADGVLHVFGPSALRRLHFATVGIVLPPIVLSLTGRELLGRLDVWLANRLMRVLVPHRVAFDAVVRQGVSADLITVVPLAVAEPAPPLDRDAFCREHGLPTTVPLLATAGHMNRRDDLFGALWSFEFFRYVETESRLLIVGDGPAFGAMVYAAEGLAPEGSRAHFLGARSNAAAILGFADIVLVPQLTGGINVALEAMAAGRTVVAANTADLRSVIQEGETGLFAPPRDAPVAARVLLRVVHDLERQKRLGVAARSMVRERHSIAAVSGALQSFYV